MRVASMQSVMRYQTQLNNSWERSTKYMEQADGSKLHRPSDDSVAYSQYLRYQNSLAENVQYQSNVKNAVSWMKSADDVMVDMTDLLKTVTAKTVDAANETNNEDNLRDIGVDLYYKIQQVVALGNSQSGDRYLFAGQADLTCPFVISTEKSSRALTRSLNDSQAAYFVGKVDDSGNCPQMLALKGDDGNNYFLSTITGDIYSEYFALEGYKDQIAAGYLTETQAEAGAGSNAVGTYAAAASEGFIANYFDAHGVLKDGAKDFTTTATVEGVTVTLKFDYVDQYICTYSGDPRHISMTKQNGAVDVTSDTVNISGQELFGANIFDNDRSGNSGEVTYNGETKKAASGTAAINDLLMVVAKMDAADFKWMSSDGITVSDTSHATVVRAQTGIAARHNVYESVVTMLESQNEVITNDITEVSGTDVAQLAVKMMEAQTLYNMMLSVGARILPTSLADYL